ILEELVQSVPKEREVITIAACPNSLFSVDRPWNAVCVDGRIEVLNVGGDKEFESIGDRREVLLGHLDELIDHSAAS
ncbi:hypothetical protein, partial [Mycobacterium sp.]|uniref:hypothetical protein n=1 Tax=Mycobacterium sp. TaxID=1785 RepID=UPI003F98416C